MKITFCSGILAAIALSACSQSGGESISLKSTVESNLSRDSRAESGTDPILSPNAYELSVSEVGERRSIDFNTSPGGGVGVSMKSADVQLIEITVVITQPTRVNCETYFGGIEGEVCKSVMNSVGNKSLQPGHEFSFFMEEAKVVFADGQKGVMLMEQGYFE